MKKYFMHADLCSLLGAAVLMTVPAADAFAIPSFARETGMECAMCHVGSFGPQLTDYGRTFKLLGYQTGAEKKEELKDYLNGFSAMIEGGVEHTNGDLRKGVELTDKQARYHTNDNLTADQISIFYGGPLAQGLGLFAEVTYDNAAEQVSWDNTDIRYANSTQLAGKYFVYGVSVNNNPSVQDLWQTTPAWGFPYVSSAFLPGPTASPYITSLGGSVVGAGVYGMWDNMLYAELTGYTTLPNSMQRAVGITGSDQSDHLNNLAPYWRVALQQSFGQHYVELGTFGIHANRYPGNVRDFGTDKITDYALDATYQYTSSDMKHIFSAYGSALREHARLDSSFAQGDAANTTDNLTSLQANFSYYYDNTYGLTVSPFSITGTADANLYANPVNNKPDSAGWVFQADYTPFGKEGTYAYPYFNLRLFAQYTAYTKFNGLSSNYDGTGRRASDNNLLFFGAWLAF